MTLDPQSSTRPNSDGVTPWASAGALFSALFSRNRREEISRDDRRTLLGQLDELKAGGISVREVKIAGPRFVAFITDIHNAEFQPEITRQLPIIYDKLQLQLLGLEGWTRGPTAAPRDEGLSREIAGILDSNLARRVPEDQVAAHGFPPGTALIPRAPTKPFATDPRFFCVGLEGPAFPEVDRQLLIFVRERLAEACAQLEKKGLVIFGIEDRLFDYFHALDNAQRHLSTRYSDFPIFDFGRLPSISPESTTSRYPALMKGLLDDLLPDIVRRVEVFEQIHCGEPRSIQAASVIEAELKERGLVRAGIIFGLMHGINLGRGTRSIQSCLAESNISYAVIDPMPLKIKRSGGNVSITLPVTWEELAKRRNELGPPPV